MKSPDWDPSLEGAFGVVGTDLATQRQRAAAISPSDTEGFSLPFSQAPNGAKENKIPGWRRLSSLFVARLRFKMLHSAHALCAAILEVGEKHNKSCDRLRLQKNRISV